MLDVYSMDGGIEAWKAAGLPVIKHQHIEKCNKTKIFEGLVIITSTLMSILFSSKFFLIFPIIIGISLILIELKPDLKEKCYITKVSKYLFGKCKKNIEQ